MPKFRLAKIGLGLLAFATSSFAAEGPLELLNFGLTERLTYRHNHPGTNWSTMALWQPRYNFSDTIRVGLDLGAAPMRQLNDDFIGFRYNVGIELYPEWIVHPELIAGAESWTTPGGFTSAVFGANALLRTDFYFVSHALLGFHLIKSRDYSSRQVNIGLRFSF